MTVALAERTCFITAGRLTGVDMAAGRTPYPLACNVVPAGAAAGVAAHNVATAQWGLLSGCPSAAAAKTPGWPAQIWQLADSSSSLAFQGASLAITACMPGCCGQGSAGCLSRCSDLWGPHLLSTHSDSPDTWCFTQQWPACHPPPWGRPPRAHRAPPQSWSCRRCCWPARDDGLEGMLPAVAGGSQPENACWLG